MAGLYVHIPFCLSRCGYCDFYSCTQLEYKDAYLAALLQEIELRKDAWKDEVFDTIYIGGGTPSLLQRPSLADLLNSIYHTFSVSEHPEITIEANPNDLSETYVSSLKNLPFNRISIGIQSFNDRELQLLNRRHTAQEAIEAVERCRRAGIENISVDLIYGIPRQTIEDWSQTLDKVTDLDITHISAYHLSYEEGTVIYQQMRNGEVQPVDEETSEACFFLLVKKLTKAGFLHYEISNFARISPAYPLGQIAIHNTSYWKGVHYLGLGASAHSYDGQSRFWNVASLQTYIYNVRANNGVWFESEKLDERAKYNDYIITRLRTKWGISLKDFQREFGVKKKDDFLIKSTNLIDSNKLQIEGDIIKVSFESIFITDAILRELIV